jgi:hypothetical protein
MSNPVPFTGDEKDILHVSLDRHRDAVLWKLEGLDEEQLRRPMVPTGTSLLGIVKHLADCEYGWFCWTFGRATEPGGNWSRFVGPRSADDDDNDEWLSPDDTAAAMVAYFGRARAAADLAIDNLGMDAVGSAFFGPTVSMRWVLVHVIEDTARHAGHMDILRESIDGQTGHHRPV